VLTTSLRLVQLALRYASVKYKLPYVPVSCLPL